MTCKLCNDTGEQRYWEGRWRNEKAENEKLRIAIGWALGQQPDSDGKWFSEDRNDRAQGQGRRYWWRSHLRKIAGLPTFAYEAELFRVQCRVLDLGTDTRLSAEKLRKKLMELREEIIQFRDR